MWPRGTACGIYVFLIAIVWHGKKEPLSKPEEPDLKRGWGSNCWSFTPQCLSPPCAFFICDREIEHYLPNGLPWGKGLSVIADVLMADCIPTATYRWKGEIA